MQCNYCVSGESKLFRDFLSFDVSSRIIFELPVVLFELRFISTNCGFGDMQIIALMFSCFRILMLIFNVFGNYSRYLRFTKLNKLLILFFPLSFTESWTSNCFSSFFAIPFITLVWKPYNFISWDFIHDMTTMWYSWWILWDPSQPGFRLVWIFQILNVTLRFSLWMSLRSISCGPFVLWLKP